MFTQALKLSENFPVCMPPCAACDFRKPVAINTRKACYVEYLRPVGQLIRKF